MKNIKKIDRLGEINYNFYGSKMTIIEYIRSDNIIVQFEDGHIINTTYDNFIKGIVKNPYDKSVYGVGYIGEGEYQASVNNKKTIIYDKWVGMIKRCYDSKYHTKEPTYKNCTATEEWHNFQIFAKWFDENYYTVDNEVMELDKDILHKAMHTYKVEITD